MSTPMPRRQKSVAVVALLGGVYVCSLVIGFSSPQAAAEPLQRISVALPLPDDDRMPDPNAPAMAFTMLPDLPPADIPQGRVVLDKEIAANTPDVSDVRTEEVHAPKNGAVILGEAPPDGRVARRLLHALGIRPPAGPDNVVRLSVLSPDAGSPASAFIEAGATPIDFQALQDENGNVVIRPDDFEGSRNLIVPPGRFASKTLTLESTATQLQLDGAQITIARQAHILPAGRIITHVRQTPAGLDLGQDAAIQIDRDARIVLFFQGAPSVEGIHWGMRAKGDRRAEFRRLIESGRIIVVKIEAGAIALTKAVIIFDGEYTYITIDYPKYDKPVNSEIRDVVTEPYLIPEPAALALLGLGGVVLLTRKR